MKPKLILLNGPLGIGKSTLAKLYTDKHPLTLLLDIDTVWSMIGQWREQQEKSAPLSKQIALEMARVTLLAGNDVVIPQIIQTVELAESFEKLAISCNADMYEVLLYTDKQDSIQRFITRGKSQGYPTGFRSGGVIDTGGREVKLAAMYDNMIEAANLRPRTIKIDVVFGDIDTTYDKLVKAIN